MYHIIGIYRKQNGGVLKVLHMSLISSCFGNIMVKSLTGLLLKSKCPIKHETFLLVSLLAKHHTTVFMK